jgi:UDP-N-acetylglucosamine--N-acetylmuramyl-(pentapeptide) pyrophosphoryl-undecaprenol N-acetylglucosamine transferase
LISEALKLLFDEHQAKALSENISKLAKPNATNDIVNEIEKIIGINKAGSSSNAKSMAVVMS